MNHYTDLRNNNGTSIDGPIAITQGNFITKLAWSENFDVSFEFKASWIPSDGSWHEIIEGKLISDFQNRFLSLKIRINDRSNNSINVKKLRRPVIHQVECLPFITDSIKRTLP